eukprot:364481-Chlamydomonas_euryale.AAC.22
MDPTTAPRAATPQPRLHRNETAAPKTAAAVQPRPASRSSSKSPLTSRRGHAVREARQAREARPTRFRRRRET